MSKIANKQLGLALSLCILPTSFAMALPLLTITPQNYSYHDRAVARGTSVTIPYTITNNTPATLNQLMATKLPSGASSSVCNLLAPGQSCTININIPASLTSYQGVIQSRFQVCASGNFGCTLVSPGYQINITVVNSRTFLAITDMHLDGDKIPPITYGEDTDLPLWNSTLNEVSTLINTQAPAFIIFTGDLPTHGSDYDVNPNQQKDIATVLNSISSLPAISNNHLPVFYATGNNDSLVSDYGEFFDEIHNHNLFYLDPAHNGAETGGWPTLNTNPDCSVSPNFACTYSISPMPQEHKADMANAKMYGYYSAYPLGSATPLRLISLNSVIFSAFYLPKLPNPASKVRQKKEAQAQMDWLKEQLKSAKKNNESVYIIMHVPAGFDAFNDCNDMWNTSITLKNGLNFRDTFLILMQQYKDTIRVVVSAHTHENELRALYPDTTLTSMEVLGVGVPGITPDHSNNPGVQVFLYNNSFQLTEAKTFFTTPNPSGWQTFSFINDYACPQNSTLFSCVSTNVLPQLPAWINSPQQPIPGNPYEVNYPVRNPIYTPMPYSTWMKILEVIQVVPGKVQCTPS